MILTSLVLIAQGAGADVFGTISPPPGVSQFASGPAGLIVFVSNIIKIITIIAGLYGLFNVIAAGYAYLNSNGNPKATEQAVQLLLNSALGLAIIVASFTITAIVSFLLFGDATFILNPDIPTTGTTPAQ